MKIHSKVYVKTFSVLALVGACILLFSAPTHLRYYQKPVASDCVILFLGPEYESRKKEAFKLIDKGFAANLLVPARNQVIHLSQKGVPNIHSNTANTSHLHEKVYPKHPSFLENTHVELVRAQVIMEMMGYRSALLVSSPYHMRRIKIIAEAVFEDECVTLHFVPSRFEDSASIFWFLSVKDVKNVLSEYAKILWFFIYRPFI